MRRTCCRIPPALPGCQAGATAEGDHPNPLLLKRRVSAGDENRTGGPWQQRPATDGASVENQPEPSPAEALLTSLQQASTKFSALGKPQAGCVQPGTAEPESLARSEGGAVVLLPCWEG